MSRVTSRKLSRETLRRDLRAPMEPIKSRIWKVARWLSVCFWSMVIMVTMFVGVMAIFGLLFGIEW